MKITKNRIRILLVSTLLLTVSCWEGFNDTLIGNDSVDPAEVTLTTATTTSNGITISWTAPTMTMRLLRAAAHHITRMQVQHLTLSAALRQPRITQLQYRLPTVRALCQRGRVSLF